MLGILDNPAIVNFGTYMEVQRIKDYRQDIGLARQMLRTGTNDLLEQERPLILITQRISGDRSVKHY